MYYKLEEACQAPDNWDLTLDQLGTLVAAKQNPDLEDRLKFITMLAKSMPLDRSPWYDLAREVLENVADSTAEISGRIRTELDLEEYVFAPKWDMTEEQLEEFERERAEREAARQKASKKKPKTEEDLARDKETYKERLAAELAQEIITGVVNRLDYDPYLQNKRHLDLVYQARTLPKILANTNRLNKMQKNSNIANNIIAQNAVAFMNEDTIGAITRKYNLNDVDMEGRRVCVRLNLDVELVKEEVEESKLGSGNMSKEAATKTKQSRSR
jgi:hypothetical protein